MWVIVVLLGMALAAGGKVLSDAKGNDDPTVKRAMADEREPLTDPDVADYGGISV